MNMLRHQKTCTKNIEQILDAKEKQQLNDKMVFRQILQNNIKNGDKINNEEIFKSLELGNDQTLLKNITEQNTNIKHNKPDQNLIFNTPQCEIQKNIEPQKSDSLNTKWKKMKKIYNETKKFLKSNTSLLGNHRNSDNNISDLNNSNNIILNSINTPNVSNITPISNALNSFLQGKSFDSCLNTIDMKILEESENSNTTSMLKNLTFNSLIEDSNQKTNSNVKHLINKLNELTFIDNKHLTNQDSPRTNRKITNNLFQVREKPMDNMNITKMSMPNNPIANSQNKNFFQKVERNQKIIKINSKKRFHPIVEFSDTKQQTPQPNNISSIIIPQKRDKLIFQSMDKKSKSPYNKVITNSFKEHITDSMLK